MEPAVAAALEVPEEQLALAGRGEPAAVDGEGGGDDPARVTDQLPDGATVDDVQPAARVADDQPPPRPPS